MSEIMKTCKRCGEEKPREEFYKLKGKQYDPEWDCRDSHCKTCRKQYQADRLRERKREAVEYLGGKCQDCGLVSHACVYDFHHRDPSQKDFTLGKNFKSFASIKDELDKCDLLCANCHRIRHHV